MAHLALAGLWTFGSIEARWRAAWPAARNFHRLLDALLDAVPAATAARMSADQLQAWLSERGAHRLLSEPSAQTFLPAGVRRVERVPRALRWCVESMPPVASSLDFQPPIDSVPALAEWLGLEQGELRWLTAECRGHRHYRYRQIPRRTGGIRLLEIPKQRLKQVQRQVLQGLLPASMTSAHAHGFVPGRSPLSHARLHCKQACLLQLDLRDWFPGICLPRVITQFLDLGYRPSVALVLARLCTHRTDSAELLGLPPQQRQSWRSRHLPQGAPTSPALANLCARGMDRRIAAYAAAAGWRYSRYADDLVLSSCAPGELAFRHALPALAAIVRDEGFVLNPAKTRICGQNQRQSITGIVVNDRPNIDRPWFDRIKAEVHAWCTGRQPLVSASPAVREAALQRLRGQIAWLGQVHPARGERLRKRLEAAGLV